VIIFLLIFHCLYSTVRLAHCIDSVDDVQQSGNNVIGSNQTVIVPNLNFTCNGWITNIKVGINPTINGSDFPYIQIWRPSPSSQLYSLVDKVQLHPRHINTQLTHLEANIPHTGNIKIQFLSGDVIGFYNPPNSSYVIRDTTTNSHVYYTFNGSDAKQIDLNAGIISSRRQPLIEFTLGEYDNNDFFCCIWYTGFTQHRKADVFGCRTGKRFYCRTLNLRLWFV